jgi:hypothetical protein
MSYFVAGKEADVETLRRRRPVAPWKISAETHLPWPGDPNLGAVTRLFGNHY